MAKVTILYYSKTNKTKALAEVIKGILDPMLPGGFEIEVIPATTLEFERFKDSAAFIFGTPDYFSDVAGYLKIFFDDLWEQRADLQGRPAMGFVTHGGGGKATGALEHLCSSFKLNYVKPTISTDKPADEKLKAQIKANCAKLVKLLK
ncbi:MAG: NAD(P)H-dependent oxidoreductase [Candidatus Lokiarchaeota archaeon]|nr:NAD(P)H-dependent oxidoreductase [Candidatus Lokiarchaeota archaeon]